jgi:hypothetical protein
MSDRTTGLVHGAEDAGIRRKTAGSGMAGFTVTGIAAGTVVLTLDGALPVDFIEAGDIYAEGLEIACAAAGAAEEARLAAE